MFTRLDIYRTAIPMRGFEHAAASREVAEAIVVRLQTADGRVGWGETLPREYVTGESFASVIADIENTLFPRLVLDPRAALPERIDGRIVNAAACALELARADAGQELCELSRPGKKISARVSGVLGSSDPQETAKRLRLMRWFALRDFKLKLALGDEIDAENLRVVGRIIGKSVAAGRCSLRVDVNGAWDSDSAPERIAELKSHGVSIVEQPVFCSGDEFVDLARRCDLPLMADESLLTQADAQKLLEEPQRIAWNIRLSKNGGLGPSGSLLRLAAQGGVTVTLGCMVGESGILSAAQRRLLQVSPPVRFVEGNYGKFLLTDDLTHPSIRFGYAGRLKVIKSPGLGVRIDEKRLERYGELVRTLKGDSAI